MKNSKSIKLLTTRNMQHLQVLYESTLPTCPFAANKKV